jgi:hypothetical protein
MIHIILALLSKFITPKKYYNKKIQQKLKPPKKWGAKKRF